MFCFDRLIFFKLGKYEKLVEHFYAFLTLINEFTFALLVQFSVITYAYLYFEPLPI